MKKYKKKYIQKKALILELAKMALFWKKEDYRVYKTLLFLIGAVKNKDLP